MHRAEWVQIALYSGRTLYRRCYVWLAAQPRDQAFGQRRIIQDKSTTVCSENCGECRRRACDLRETSFHQCFGSRRKCAAIRGSYLPLGEDVLLQRIEPSIYRRPQRTIGGVGGCQTFHEPPVNSFPSMEGCFSFRYLDLGRGEAGGASAFL